VGVVDFFSQIFWIYTDCLFHTTKQRLQRHKDFVSLHTLPTGRKVFWIYTDSLRFNLRVSLSFGEGWGEVYSLQSLSHPLQPAPLIAEESAGESFYADFFSSQIIRILFDFFLTD
jgi:hypothetical protein